MKRNNDEIINRIISAIEQSGRDIDGYQAGEIDRRTFYRWMRSDELFRERVEAARNHFKKHSLPQLRRYATQGLKRTLEAVAEGREIITTTRSQHLNPKTGEVIELETVQRQPAMVPIQQAFKYVMGKEIDLVIWLHQGVDLGVFPRAFVEDMIDDIDAVTDRLRSRIAGEVIKPLSETATQGIDPGVAIASALGLVDGDSPKPVGVQIPATAGFGET